MYGVKECYVIYEHRKREDCKWYQLPLKEGFRHCWVLYHDSIGWSYANRTHGFLDVGNAYVFGTTMASDMKSEDVVRFLTDQGHIVQKVDVSLFRSTKMRTPWHLTISNCTELVKDFVGVSGFFMMTPYQLYKHIQKNT